ncbi:hypothetical protein HIM_01041 [Hirsutella minnesotensis 3608]|nr:hypothetical protein HIM_01041 [Hirsutella minnesotensis 3608]
MAPQESSPTATPAQSRADSVMIIESEEIVADDEPMTMSPSAEVVRMRRRSYHRAFSQASRSRDAGMRPIASFVSASHRANLPCSGPEPGLSPIAADPTMDVAFTALEADEGYCEGSDDMSWLACSKDNLLGGFTRTYRSNGVLKFRTSTEAALQCSMVVHKTPRMRRRRHNKLETRLKSSTTLSGVPEEPQARVGRAH